MKHLPRIPRSVPGILGPIRVLRAAQVILDGVDCYGVWDSEARTITVRSGLSLAKAHHILWHERTHADLDESHVVLTSEQEEAVCDGIATARVAEMLAAL